MEFRPHNCNVLRVTRSRSPSIFKQALDTFLKTIPDEPHTPGYTYMRRAKSNSLIHMTPLTTARQSSISEELDYHGSIGIPHDPYILPYRHTPRPSHQTDIHTLATYQCRTNYFKCSFFPPNNCCLECTPQKWGHYIAPYWMHSRSQVALGRPIPS